MNNRIFSFDSAKAIKAKGYGYLNAIHYMAPHRTAGVGDLCGNASPACIKLCLGLTSGQAGIVADINSKKAQGNKCRQSRVDKARRFMRDRAAYLLDVVRSIDNLIERAQRLELQLALRPNGSTDIAWEAIRFTIERNAKGKAIAITLGGPEGKCLMDHYPTLPWIDYTKNPRRFDKQLPANYHLTFSHSEINLAHCIDLLQRGHNVAVVFAGEKPKLWYGHTVIDGDLHDLRHLDPKGGYVIALSPKGRKAKRDKSGFVVRGQQQQYAMAA